MVSTRNTGVVRILVAVTDASLIPDATDIVVDDGIYEIFFKVESIVDGGGRAVDHASDHGDENMEDPNNNDSFKDSDRDSKRPKITEKGISSASQDTSHKVNDMQEDDQYLQSVDSSEKSVDASTAMMNIPIVEDDEPRDAVVDHLVHTTLDISGQGSLTHEVQAEDTTLGCVAMDHSLSWPLSSADLGAEICEALGVGRDSSLPSLATAVSACVSVFRRAETL